MNIQEKLTCKCCNEIYNNPVALTCGDTVCRHHIDELISNNSSTIMCPLCNEENSIQNLKVNKLIQSLLEIELHEFKMNPIYETVLDNLKKQIRGLETILKDPENCIYEEISELKRQVDLDRENMKIQIDELANDVIQQLESYEKQFKAEYKAIDLEHYNCLLESSKKQLIEYERCLSLLSTTTEERYRKRVESEKLIDELQPKIKVLKEMLSSKLSISYESTKIEKVDLFGKVIIKEIQQTNKKDFLGKVKETLSEHSGTVYALAVLNNGDLISGSSDDTVKIWNFCDWTVKQTLHGHADWLRDILILDNNTIINAANDFSITVWNLNQGLIEKTLSGHAAAINALVLLQNGDLASGSNDFSIRIWNIEDGTLKKTLIGHSKGVWSLLQLKNGDLASGSDDLTIKIWDVDIGTIKMLLTGHTGEIDTLALLHNGDLVSGSEDKTIKIWDIEDGTVKRTLTGHAERIFALKELKNGNLVSGSWDCTVKIWNIEDDTILKDITLESEINSLEVLQNNDLVIGCKDGTIKIFN